MADRQDQRTRTTQAETVTLEPMQGVPGGVPVIKSAALLEKICVLLTVELGRTKIPIKELRQLRHGQVITLEQMVGEPLSIFANGNLIGSGEVVAVPKDQFGIRITGLADEAEPAGGPL